MHATEQFFFAYSTAQTVLENHKVQKEGSAQQEGLIRTISHWWEVHH
jgi:hypothetical protein